MGERELREKCYKFVDEATKVFLRVKNGNAYTGKITQLEYSPKTKLWTIYFLDKFNSSNFFAFPEIYRVDEFEENHKAKQEVKKC